MMKSGIFSEYGIMGTFGEYPWYWPQSWGFAFMFYVLVDLASKHDWHWSTSALASIFLIPLVFALFPILTALQALVFLGIIVVAPVIFILRQVKKVLT